jgi:hydrophobe/amphiphile efflux-1 (HAE1) family protein
MNISGPFIRRPVGTSLLAMGLFLLGLIAYRFLPVAPVPRVDYPVISVNAGLPGADPTTMASSVAAPLEKRLGQISGVSEMTSMSSLGSCSVTVQFDLDRNIEGAARDVQAAINAAASDLPIDLPGPPTWRKVNPADMPVMVMALTSDTLPASTIFQYADEIVGQRLSQVEGVSQVGISGSEKSAVNVLVDPAALASTGYSLEDIRTMVGQVNVDLPKGGFSGAKQSYIIESNDQLTQAGQYRRLIVAQKNGVPVRLDALGEVAEGVENKRLAGWAGTNDAVLVFIMKQAGANIIDTVERVRQALPEVQRWIPPAIKFTPINDRTTTIRASFHDVQISMALTIALVVMVIFLFLRRFWPTFIASITVPLAIAGTLGFMYLLNFSLDNLSLMALTISVGFVVDDAIVVIENTFRFIEQGEATMPAALKGARQIGFTVVSMSTSLIAVFIPLLFMGGLVGRLFHEFAVTLSLAIFVSGVISLTLTPTLCSRFLRPESTYGPPGPFCRASERAFNWLLGGYQLGLRWVLRHQAFMLLVALLTCFFTVYLYSIVPKGFFPPQDNGQMGGQTEAAQDISFQAMEKLQRQAAAIVLADPAVASMGSFIGGSSMNNGHMFISLKPKAERKIGVDAVIDRLRPKLAKLEAINVFLQPSQDIRMGGRGSKSLYQYALTSVNLDDLLYWSDALIKKLQEYPQLKEVTSDQQAGGLQANVVVDRVAAARLQVTPAAIDQTLYDAFGQRQVSVIYGRYNQYHVILQAQPQFLQDPESLQKIYVKSTSGKQVPLSSLARFEPGNAYLSVSHQGQFPCSTISFNLAPGVSLGEATTLIEQAKEELRMPASVQGSFQGTARVFQSSLSNMPVLFAAAMLTVYIVLGMLYESLVHPLTILSSLPSAGVGALLALMFCGEELSLISFIGIILLMGIVKKNAIMMVDFAIYAERTEHLSPEEAIYKACIIRFRPIMMTTMAALLGSLPLAIGMGTGSELRQPMGVAVVGGLLLSQTLTLFTTPVIYVVFEKLKLRVGRRRRRVRRTPAEWMAA